MAFKFSQPLDIAIAYQVKLPLGIYWNMTDNQDIMGLYKNKDECNYDNDSLKSLLQDIERQAQRIERVVKTPTYTRKAKKAYYERQKMNNPDFLSSLNEKNKARQRIKREIKAIMNICL